MTVYLIITVTSLGMIVLLTMILLLIRKRAYASIAVFSWERSITLEQQVWVKETSYQKFPKDSINRREKQENYRYSKIVSRGKYVYRPENPGSGDYEWVSEPETEWKWGTRVRYEYEVPQWQRGRTLLANGRSRDDVHWPDYVHAENVRVSKKKERYTVCFVTENGKRYYKNVAEHVWAEFDANARYLIKTTLFGKVATMQPVQTEFMFQ
ncbi:MAG: hypothetical protein JO011_19735 [Ktedonobacteraceae bacterium]|nr:hypothetical protein [Ktedonobacteraceae bacterium]